MMLRMLLMALLVASSARASNVVLSHSGYVLGADDRPLDSTESMAFSIWNDASATAPGNRVWPAAGPVTCAVTLRAGYFSVLLGGAPADGGCGTGLDGATFASDPVYLQVSVGSVELTPRVRLDAVPASRRAFDADRLDGRTRAELVAELDATYATDVELGAHAGEATGVHGVTGSVVGTGGAQTLTGKSIDANTNDISNLGDAEIAAAAGIARSKLAAGTANALVVNDASGVMSALVALDLARGGTGATTKAGAFANLSPLAATGDLLAFGGGVNDRLPLGANGQVLTVDTTQGLGLKWATPSAAGNGSVPQGTTPPVACTSGSAGQLYYNTADKQIYGCNGVNYVAMGVSGNSTGGTPATALASCEAIKAFNTSLPSDVYFIDPNGGDTSDAYQVYCNMDLDTGGWALAMNLDSGDGSVRSYSDSGFWTGSGAVGAVTNARGADYKNASVFASPARKVMVVVHQEGSVIGWRVWDTAAVRSLQAFLLDSAARTPVYLTGTSTNASVGSLDAREAVVKPAGRLRANMVWGSDVSFDLARIRNDALAGTDNALWGLGSQMDAQNNNGAPFYPGCDAGSTDAWTGYFCIGSDKACTTNCGSTSGGTQALDYDYAIYVKPSLVSQDPALAGNSAATAVADCEALAAARPTAGTGSYWLSTGGTPAQGWCELNTALDGGGWTLAMNVDSSDGNTRNFTDPWWTNGVGFGTGADALTHDYKNEAFFSRRYRKMLVVLHREGAERIGWRSYNMAGPHSLENAFRSDASRSDNLLTAGFVAGDVAGVDTREVVIRPSGELRVNAAWGSTVSYDLARVRSASLDQSDNVNWGIGMQMDAQNNSQNPLYPGCDVATSEAWSGAFCAGADKGCTSQCGSMTGGSRDLEWDYAFYVKDAVATPSVDPALLGNSAATAGTTCEAIRLARPTAPTGAYYIAPGGTAYQVWCDMDLASGGWNLAVNLDTSDGRVRNYTDTTFWASSTAAGAFATALTEDYKNSDLWTRSFTKMLVRVHKENLETVGWKAWNLAATTSLSALLATAQSRTPTAITASTIASSTSLLDGREAVVLPSGNLRANMIWGSAVSYDLARIRNDALTGSDNLAWGLGIQMDAQNNSQNPYYPGCDAGSTDVWDLYFCIGGDKACTSGFCGDGGTSSRFLSYDYAIYVK